MEVTRKQSTPNFPKNEYFLPPDTRVKNVRFSREIWRALFSYCPRFEIRPFCFITDEMFTSNENAALDLHTRLTSSGFDP